MGYSQIVVWHRRFLWVLSAFIATGAQAEEPPLTVEPLPQAAAGDSISAPIGQLLSPTGWSLMQGEKNLCNIWLTREWSVSSDFQPTGEVNYPFAVGQLIGVVQFPRRAREFRDQTVKSGFYTLRYAQQPVDGNHVGTSVTRDFLLLVKAQDDQRADAWDLPTLITASAEASSTTHPAMWCLLPVDANSEPPPSPALRFTPDHGWWILRIAGQTQREGKQEPLVLDVVVLGHAQEG